MPDPTSKPEERCPTCGSDSDVCYQPSRCPHSTPSEPLSGSGEERWTIYVCAACRQPECSCPRIEDDGTVTGFVPTEVVPASLAARYKAEAEKQKRIAAAFKGWRGREVVDRRTNLIAQVESERTRAEAAEQARDERDELLARIANIAECDHETLSGWAEAVNMIHTLALQTPEQEETSE